MSLRSIELFHVSVPLRKAIRHASHVRSTSDNLVVCATLRSGQVGYGEGVPRSYVTGETIESAFQHDRLVRLGTAPRARPATYPDVVKRLEELMLPETAADPRGMAGNARVARWSWRSSTLTDACSASRSARRSGCSALDAKPA